MKRFLTVLFICALLVLTALSVTAEEMVSTVDELLSAIRPGAVITLEGKTYNLTEASDYGKRLTGKYYYWAETVDGYELNLEDVDNLTLAGTDGTSIVTDPRYANVLYVEDCDAFTVKGITFGHTDGALCGAAVLYFEDCEDTTVEGCRIFGCGQTGIIAYACEKLTVTESTVYDCTYSGADLYSSHDVLVNDCTFTGIGSPEEDDYFYADGVFNMFGCRYVTVMNSVIAGNATGCLLQSDASRDVVFTGCRTEDNGFSDAIFRLAGYGITVSGCSFAEAASLPVYSSLEGYGDVQAADTEGVPLTGEALAAMTAVSAETRPESKTVTVKTDTGLHYYEVATADEFIAAIGSHRVICVTADINLSDATGEEEEGENWSYIDAMDGKELCILRADDLKIVAKESGITITTDPRYANVLNFAYCSDIELMGLTIGHTEGIEGECSGGVLLFTDCDDIEIEDCRLFGCGTVGISAMDCGEIEVEDTEIYDCSEGAVTLFSVKEAEFSGCYVHDCATPELYVDTECGKIEIDDKRISSGSHGWYD